MPRYIKDTGVASYTIDLNNIDVTSVGDAYRRIIPGIASTQVVYTSTSNPNSYTWVPTTSTTYTSSPPPETNKRRTAKKETVAPTWERKLRRDGKCLHGSSSLLWCAPCQNEKAAWDAEQAQKLADEIERVEDNKKKPTKAELAAEVESLRHKEPGTATDIWARYVREAFNSTAASQPDQIVVNPAVYESLKKHYRLSSLDSITLSTTFTVQ